MKKLALILIAIGCLFAAPGVASAATYTVDSIGDQPDETLGDEECETSANTCTLRAAIEEANESVGTADAIDFDGTEFKGQLADTITLGSLLPEIEDQASIEGGVCTTQAGPQGPCVGIQATGLSYGLSAEDVEGVTIEGVAVTGATTGIRAINEAEKLTVRGSWLGVKLDGTNGTGASTGIWLDPGSNEATIGGSEASQRNVIVNSAAEGLDVEGASEAVVRGNYFGVKADGKTKAANGKDIEITDTVAFEAIENEVGATVASGVAPCDGGCNVISGGTFAGIDLQGNGGNEEPATGPTTIHGNYIGLSADGTETVANGSYGVYVGKAPNVLVGGSENADANFIAGSAEGIATENAEGFEAVGNVFGAGAAGAEITAPGTGVFVLNTNNANQVAVTENVFEMDGGVAVEARFGGTEIASNFIEGAEFGVWTKAGPNAAGGNLIKANVIGESLANGIWIEDAQNEVLGNAIYRSGEAGVLLELPVALLFPTENLIGGNTKGSENNINESGGPAIQIVDESGNTEEDSFNEVGRNKGAKNAGPFIDLVGEANAGILPPVIGAAKLGSASGSGAEAGANVRVFRKATASTGELESFLGEATADGSGNWTVTYAAAIPGDTQIAATQTSVEGGTSELAFAKTEPAPKTEGGGGSGGGGGSSSKDKTPPQTKIVKGPKAKTHATTVKFKFSSSEAGSTFECKLDKQPFKPCRSPKKYKKLKPGKHVFKVWAIDKAGNVDPTPAKKKFKILG
ncbi:MAG TPA: NosD domain-containing protein [Solirubrobacterales bacterium]|nr:NosD domain-containing protein [Solirubrobacterales bacterium]